MDRLVLVLNILVFTVYCCAICFYTPLVSRYRLYPLKAGIVYMFAVLLSIIGRLVLSIQHNTYRGEIYTDIYILTSAIDLVSIILISLALPALIHAYLDKRFPYFLVPVMVLQFFSLPFSLIFFTNTIAMRFLYSVVISCALFFIIHVYCLVLMLINLFNKNVFQKSYLYYALTLGLIYIVPGFLDCFWPLFPAFYSLKESGLNFSILLPFLTAMLVIPHCYHYLIQIGLQPDCVPQLTNRYNFTARETEVFDLIVKGYTNNQIAANLRISASTVKKHVYSMFQKTESENRIDLINSCRHQKF